MKEVFNESVDGKQVVLMSNGYFTIDGIERHWYKDKNSKPWIPVKRSSLVGLIKQIIRD